MDTKELLKKVRKIEIKTKGLTNHMFSGEYHSAFKGKGMSFSEVRNYMPGDDIRTIDWNVTARTGEPFIKLFEEERELTVMLMVDISKSVYFGTERQTKKHIIAEIAAVLAFSAISNSDKVGLILFSDKVEMYIPPKKGKPHILRIIREMINVEPSGEKTDLGKALKFFRNVMKKRCICFILSDFIVTDYNKPLKVAKGKHDIVGLQIYDTFERELPDWGMLKVRDSESGELRWLDSSDKKVRQAHRERFKEWTSNSKNIFKMAGAELLSICVDEAYIPILLSFFKRRSGA